MVVCDTNIWLALSIQEHVHHSTVRTWFESVEEPESIAFCRVTQQSYLRLVTSAAILHPYGHAPFTNHQAWDAFLALRSDFRVTFVGNEPAGLEQRWNSYALRDTASPKLWMDAYLAAFASTYGARFVTIDRAFQQFQDLDLLLLPVNA